MNKSTTSPLASEACRRGAGLAAETGDFGLRVVSRNYCGKVHQERGEYGQAIALHEEVIGLLDGELSGERYGQSAPPAMFARSELAVCRAQRGEFARGVTAAEEAVRIAEALHQPFGLILACLGLVETYLLQGRADQAMGVLQRALQVIESQNVPVWFPRAAAAMGHALVLAGRLEEGRKFLAPSLVRRTALPFLYGHSQWVIWSGHAHLHAGRREDALRVAEEALALSRRRGEAGYEAGALHLLGQIAAQGGPAEVCRAMTAYGDCLALAKDLGMRPLQAHCHLGLGTLPWRGGHSATAQEHLAQAVELYREMEMDRWLGQAESALAEIA